MVNGSSIFTNETSPFDNETSMGGAPSWAEPSLDAWKKFNGELKALFIHYIIVFVVGQFVNWLCLLSINKTKLTQSSRFIMLLQCSLNTAYISINFPYKAGILYLQKMFLPWPIKIFCGWLHLFCMFGSVFVQVCFTRRSLRVF